MCGRFCCSLNPEELKSRLYKENVLKHKNVSWIDETKHRASYNVCPARYIATVFQSSEIDNERIMKSMQWGYIPSWAKAAPPAKPINARVETLTENPNSVFNASKNSRRCVIVAEGFFEWNKKRQAFYIERKDKKLMLFAGLYSNSHFNDDDLTTCTIITTHASSFFSKIHDRMPVILDESDIGIWLDKNQPWDQRVTGLLKPFEGLLHCFQVTDKVGPIKNDYPELIVPIDKQKNSISQFLKPMDLKTEMQKDLPEPAVKKEAASGSNSNDSFTDTASPPKATKKRRHSSDQANKNNSKKADETHATKAPKITQFFSKGKK
ncbi:hypothetical protein BDF20DRAFT_703991 [Mycotypha africana]|uniref:uncharacterized protein n=1 Tax=Mycotypha africana TaxID=64632 RepID=UPI002301D5CE|nr:uncharacterized protein BDF20DRAFT_703991 [Mycotypha africana]KAI8971875.1 hypothetical protein BDF20DRAFT_703991 [Mycotypha africana]